MFKIASSLLLIFLYLTSQAQVFFPLKKYPGRSYINPMDFQISLAGNFGECRANHFHSGVDIRTNKAENQLVHAIADGFVSRVKIESGGFGNALYITHSDGQTSVYAHLNKYYPDLQDYILRKQYADKSWKQDIYFMPHQFPVRQGKMVAWSGNTGSSEAPHLHMEIRNTKSEAPLNPLLFYTGLMDTRAPVIKQLAVYDGKKSIYEQKPMIYSITKKGNIYQPANPLLTINSEKVYFGINADDYMENALGTLGVYEMRMYIDGKPFFAWQMDNISYDVTRYMNAQADYKTRKNGGPWIQLCHKLPNDKLQIYKSFSESEGMLDLSNGQARQVRIDVLDTKNNTTHMEFTIQGKSSATSLTCNNEFIAGKENKFKNENIEFILGPDGLYDNICFKTSVVPSNSPYSYIYEVHEPYVPIHQFFDLKLKPRIPIPAQMKDKIAVVRYPYGKETKKTGKAAILKNEMVVVNVRDFGDYEIIIDEKPPLVTTALKDKSIINQMKRISFMVKDDITGIKNCSAEVDGEWLRVVQKGDNFYYENDEHFPPGTHNFIFKASDENGNTSEQRFTLTK